MKSIGDIKPCGPECDFDWITFTQLLDGAISHCITEMSDNGQTDPVMLSKMSMMIFIQYSQRKRILQKIVARRNNFQAKQ